MQAGAKPAEAHKRTLELESPAEALGPAEKKRIVESSAPGAAAAAVGVKAEPAGAASHGLQNGSGAHHARLAMAGGDAAAGQATKQEHNSSAKGPAADAAAQDGGQTAGCAGDVSMTDASGHPGSNAESTAPHAGGKSNSAAPNGATVKQEQQDGPGLEAAQHSRAATPELKIERLDPSTGQVRSSHGCVSIYAVVRDLNYGLRRTVTDTWQM